MNNGKTHYRLAHGQKGLWYTEQFYQGTGIGNIIASMHYFGDVDLNLLNKAVNIFVEKNDAMRLHIVESHDSPVQYVVPFREQIVDIMDFSGPDGSNEFYTWIKKDGKLPFDLIDSDLYVFKLFKINNNEGGFYIKIHHLISDAWSMTLMGTEITDFYYALKEGKETEKELFPSYLAHIKHEKEYEISVKYQEDRDYWFSLFETPPPITRLKDKKDIADAENIKAERMVFELSSEDTDRINSFCTILGTSVFRLFTTILFVYLNRVTGQRDLMIGSPVLNRYSEEDKMTVGMFPNVTPIRLTVDDHFTFIELLHEVHQTWLLSMEHRRYPYNKLLEEVREKHPGTGMLYDILISYQNAKFKIVQEYETKWLFNGYETDSLAIHINDRENQGNLFFEIDYQTSLFTASEIIELYQHLIVLVMDAIQNPNKSICQLELLTEEEKNRLLYDFNNTHIDYPRTKTIHQLFEEQVERTPDNIAVVFEDKSLTYKELNNKANQIASIIRENNTGPDKIVAIMVNRSLEMIIGIMAVLKAGGAYLPIDPDYPPERIQFMLSDSKAQLLLTQKHLQNAIGFNGRTIIVDNSNLNIANAFNLENVNKSTDLAYVIYTSGSTGKPKGVMIEHKNVINYIEAMCSNIDFSAGRVIGSVTTICFDIFVTESLLPLCKGLTIIIANENEQQIPEALNKLIDNNKVKILQTTPSRFKMLLSDEASLTWLCELEDIIVGGEPFPESLLTQLKASKGGRIYNIYGPTETTVWSTIQNLTGKDYVDIGKPIANTQVYILDKNMNLLPIGIAGELCIGGDGVSRGYWQRPELNQEKFVSNPYHPGTSIYKTGDLARWLPDGNIEHLGRIDYQVKVRGYRIELGEIEASLQLHSFVRECAVVDNNDTEGNKFLCAYFVAEKTLSTQELRDHLSALLPNYMIPSYFIQIDKMPLTPNGKVDRKALPNFDGVISKAEYLPPRNEIEKMLVNIWSDILGIRNIGINDNFFELGGNSLKVIKVLVRAAKGGLSIKAKDIYKYATIRQLSEEIASIYYPNNSQTLNSEGVIILNQGTGDCNVFFIHGGSGSIGGYSNIFRNNGVELTPEFNCYAIPFNKLTGYAPLDISIENLAEEYVNKILAIQPYGEYTLAAWCIGGQIVFEMASILEHQYKRGIKSIIMFNTHAPMDWDLYYDLNLENEIYYLNHLLGNQLLIPEDIKDLNQLWTYIANIAKDNAEEFKRVIPDSVLQSLPNVHSLDVTEIIYMINTMRSLHNARTKYRPSRMLESQVYFFKPIKDGTIIDHEENIRLWQKYCENRIQVIEVDSDEHTIFDEEINDTILKLNQILSS